MLRMLRCTKRRSDRRRLVSSSSREVVSTAMTSTAATTLIVNVRERHDMPAREGSDRKKPRDGLPFLAIVITIFASWRQETI